MDRREALKTSGVLMAAGLSIGTVSALMQGCKSEPIDIDGWSPSLFSKSQSNLMAELAERILPETDTPGAKSADVHKYLDSHIKDNLEIDEQKMFLAALDDVDSRAQAKFGKSFIEISDKEKDGIIMGLSDEADVALEKDPKADVFFPVVKGMVIYSFLTSEVGATEFLKYDPVPGEFKGCIDFEEVGTPWADHKY